MGKLPTVTGAEAIAAFRKVGYDVDRVAGSHHVLKHPEREYVLTIPVHGKKAVARGTLRSQIRTAELTVEQFCDLL